MLNEEAHKISYLRVSLFSKHVHTAVDCEVVAEGKTVAAPVQRTTRALNTTMSRYFLESFFHVSLNHIFLG